jgi:hypothetical protein
VDTAPRTPDAVLVIPVSLSVRQAGSWAGFATPAAWAALTAAIGLAYGWTFRAHFAADDFGLVGAFINFPWAAWPGLFFQDWAAGLWRVEIDELRPFAALTLIVDGRLWGADPAGYHLTNLVLHFMCSALVMRIAFEVLGRDRMKALAAALLFALHPVHAEAVTWVSGRVDMLSALGLLLGFLAFLLYRSRGGAWRLMLAWGAFAFGIFAKESCLLLPIIAIAHDLTSGGARGRPRTALAPYAGWAVVLGIYAYCRSFGMDAIVTHGLSLHGPMGLAERLTGRIVSYASAMFLAPGLLPRVEWIVEQYTGVIGIAALAAAAGLAVRAWSNGEWRHRWFHAGVFYGLVWPMLAAAPLVVTYLSLRHLYTAAAGFAIGVMALLARGLPQPRRFAAAAAVVIGLGAGQLAVVLPRYQGALERSREISATVNRAAAQAAPGDVLVLDVPRRHESMWVWAWATPFAIRPPFARQDLTRRLIVIEHPSVYRRPESWPRQGTRSRLREADGDGWLVTTVAGDVTFRQLSDDEMDQVRAEPALASPSGFEHLIDELTEP